jgi:hypothetical protein
MPSIGPVVPAFVALPSYYSWACKQLAPVGYWKLGEASGTVAADEMGASPGAYVGSPTLGAAGPLVGDASTAVTFGTGKRMVTGSFARSVITSHAFWYKRDVTDSAQVLFNAGTGGLEVTWYADGRFNLTKAGVSGMWRSTGNYVDSAAWHQLVVVKEVTATTTVYHDGAPIAGSVTGAVDLVDTASARYFGTDVATTGVLLGSLAHAAIFNRALTAAEVAWLWQIGTGL